MDFGRIILMGIIGGVIAVVVQFIISRKNKK